ncbi:MAG TPA: hypothetical protein VLM76_13370, partial [Patescibacteria group bacterium]|nr:hypothetical protein [Patescibacteria group bacterium]
MTDPGPDAILGVKRSVLARDSLHGAVGRGGWAVPGRGHAAGPCNDSSATTLRSGTDPSPHAI